MRDDIFTEMFRMALAGAPPAAGWTTPHLGESHWAEGSSGSRPACGLMLHYSGDRFRSVPEGATACEGCVATGRTVTP